MRRPCGSEAAPGYGRLPARFFLAGAFVQLLLDHSRDQIGSKCAHTMTCLFQNRDATPSAHAFRDAVDPQFLEVSDREASLPHF